MKRLLVVILALSPITAFANDLLKDFDSLGGNDVLLEKAKDLNPDKNIYVVQDRIVNRYKRFEFSPEFASVMGGDNFLNTRMGAMNVHFHITPQWSLGVRYGSSSNKLSQDAENLISDTSMTGRAYVPDIDFPKTETMGFVNYYPIYGKLNMFNKGIAHFDVYATLGGGTVELRSGPTSTWTAGAGVGFWISQHLTSRLELRHQNYKAQRFDGTYNIDRTIASVQLGYLL